MGFAPDSFSRGPLVSEGSLFGERAVCLGLLVACEPYFCGPWHGQSFLLLGIGRDGYEPLQDFRQPS